MTAMVAETREIYRHGRDRDFTEKEFFALSDEMFEARRSGDMETYERIGRFLPLNPVAAKIFKEVYGKEFMLDAGFDLTEATLLYGEGWLDEPNEQ